MIIDRLRSLAGILVSAGLVGLVFPNVIFSEGCPVLIWAALVPFLAVLDGRSFRDALWMGGAWGCAVFSALCFWMWDVSPWGFVALVLALATGPVIFSLGVSLVPVSSRTLRVLVWPSLWVVGEFARTRIMGGFSWSLSHGLAGAYQTLWTAGWGGVYAPAWVVVAVNCCIYQAWKTRGQRHRYWAAAAVLLTVNFTWGAVRASLSPPPQAHLKVALVQPNISMQEKTAPGQYDANVGRHLVLTKKAIQAGQPELVVWPETAFADDILTDERWRPRLETAARNFNAYLLVGSALLDGETDLNSALLLSRLGEWAGIYHKRRLVPFTEYLPADPLSRMVAGFLNVRPYHFRSGDRSGLMPLAGTAEIPAVKMGVVICSEEVYAADFRRQTADGADFFAVLLNDGWFSRQEALSMHAQSAVLRAVENRRPVLRAANTGHSFMVDGFGRPVKGSRISPGIAGFSVGDVPLGDKAETFYVKFGDIFAWACGGFVIIVAGFNSGWIKIRRK